MMHTVLVIVTDLRRIFRALVAHQSPSVSRMMTGEHHWLGHQPCTRNITSYERVIFQFELDVVIKVVTCSKLHWWLP